METPLEKRKRIPAASRGSARSRTLLGGGELLVDKPEPVLAPFW
jgi:hypothetical protein